jgi:hypothetical protein
MESRWSIFRLRSIPNSYGGAARDRQLTVLNTTNESAGSALVWWCLARGLASLSDGSSRTETVPGVDPRCSFAVGDPWRTCECDATARWPVGADSRVLLSCVHHRRVVSERSRPRGRAGESEAARVRQHGAAGARAPARSLFGWGGVSEAGRGAVWDTLWLPSGDFDAAQGSSRPEWAREGCAG